MEPILHYRTNFKDEVVEMTEQMFVDCVFERCEIVGFPLFSAHCTFSECNRGIIGLCNVIVSCNTADIRASDLIHAA